MSKKKLLMLGTSTGSVEIIKEAKERGYYTIVTDYLAVNESEAKLVSDEYWMISTDDFEQLEKKSREENINGILCGVSQFNITATIEMAKRLHKPCYCSSKAWHYTMNKRDFKDICIKNGVPVAKDYYISNNPQEEDLAKIEYPVVVKAIDQSANTGMSYCYSAEEIIPACKKARAVSKSDVVVIERMLHGSEYTAWYALADGEISLINFSKMYNKSGYPSNCYSITTTYTDNLNQYLREIDPYIKNAFIDMGCREGVAWVEMMLDEDGHFYVLEMGHRLSGDMMALVHKNVCGFDSFAWMIDISMGIKHEKKDLPRSQIRLPERIGCSYILWSEEAGTITKWHGFDKILGTNNITVNSKLRIGSKVDKHQYLAIITFDAKDYEEMCEVIRKINREVEVHNEDGNIVIYYDNLETLKI